MILNQLNQIKDKILSSKTSQDLEALRVKLLGRNGLINGLIAKIKDQTAENRKSYGQEINKLKKEIARLIEIQEKLVPRQARDEIQEKLVPRQARDEIYSLRKLGHLHPITITENEINAVFRKIGFSIYDGPEIETDEFCFERLNVPKDHPARDMQDSIYIKEPEILLRTQGSSIEARLLSQEKPPFKVGFPCRVYRNEKVTKSNHFIFHHYQGVVVDKDITMKDLFGTIDLLFKTLYGPDVVARYRTKYYPEVEPGVGPDMECFSCHGKGCSLCKGAGWIEMGGAGIIHPYVLKRAGIDPRKWRGFAFGLGLDRWAMAKYKITDIRTLLGGNLAYKPNES